MERNPSENFQKNAFMVIWIVLLGILVFTLKSVSEFRNLIQSGGLLSVIGLILGPFIVSAILVYLGPIWLNNRKEKQEEPKVIEKLNSSDRSSSIGASNSGYRLIISLASLMSLIATQGGPLDLEYGYFQILRWVVCGASAWACFHFFSNQYTIRAVLLFLIAAIFNPFQPIGLEEESWIPINLAVAILLPALHMFRYSHKITGSFWRWVFWSPVFYVFLTLAFIISGHLIDFMNKL